MIGGPPKLGYVLRYHYDWSERTADAHASTQKARPAVVVLAVARHRERFLVRVAPVTHRPPDDAARAIEIPAPVKARLGLDGDRSWIILDHANEFVWPGPDVRPVPGRAPATIYYGPLPPSLFASVRKQLFGLLKTGRLRGLFRRA